MFGNFKCLDDSELGRKLRELQDEDTRLKAQLRSGEEAVRQRRATERKLDEDITRGIFQLGLYVFEIARWYVELIVISKYLTFSRQARK